MKIITLNWGHGPYSISKIIRDIEYNLKQEGIDFVHVQETGKLLDRNYISLSGGVMYRVYYVWAHVFGRQYGTGYIPYLKLKNIIRKEKPDIVHIHCPNAFSINLYKTFEFLKREKVNTVITNHAEFFYTGNCSYAEECMGFVDGCKNCVNYRERLHSYFFNRSMWAWKKMKTSFEQFETLRMVAVSPWVADRMKLSPITNKIPKTTIWNGIDTTVFRFRRDLPKDGKVALFVSANFTGKEDDIKGSTYLIKLAEQCTDEDIKFLVVGNDNTEGIELPSNLQVVGEIKEQKKLAEYYSLADVVVITSKRETFGMVAVESLCCGTPILAFRNGGTESVSIPEYSTFVEFGDVETMKGKLLEILKGTSGDRALIMQKAHEIYSKEKMAQDYLHLYKEMTGNE